jgi:TonB family protein
MNSLAMSTEYRSMRTRAWRAIAVSVVLHGVLLLALVRLHGPTVEDARVVEVSWLEPEAPVAPAKPVALPVPVVRNETPPPAARREDPAPRPRKAERPAPDPSAQRAAAQAPDRQAILDRQAKVDRQAKLDRLAATRATVARELNVAPASSATRQLLAGAPTGGSDIARMAAATMAPVAEKGRPVALERGPEVRGAALALNRGPAIVGGGLPLAAEASAGAGAGGVSSADEAAQPAATTVDRADIQIEGAAADRAVVTQVLPQYPDWARKQAVEAVVKLQFTVLPDGRVREDVQVTRTGGFHNFDEQAASALRRWRFAPLTGGGAAGQSGTITFRFRLRG